MGKHNTNHEKKNFFDIYEEEDATIDHKSVSNDDPSAEKLFEFSKSPSNARPKVKLELKKTKMRVCTPRKRDSKVNQSMHVTSNTLHRGN